MKRHVRATLILLAVAGAPGLSRARADGGEAGLVVQHGDGTVETYCIAFDGDGIRGDEMLRRAGVSFEHFGGLVCSLGTDPGEACPAASSFETCTCKCKGAECTYWAFFTRTYGKGWVYSALGFTAQKAGNGDLQGWKWGRGSAMSAPAPVDISFEQICGHPPAVVPGPSPTAAPTAPPPSEPAAPATAAIGETAPAGASATSSPAGAGSSAAAQSSPPPGSTPAPVEPVLDPQGREPSGGRSMGIAAFGAVVALLAVSIAAAWRWRRRGG